MIFNGKTIEAWAESIGLQCGKGGKQSTVYRWIKCGMVKPVNINGRYYITSDEEARFWQRAALGEFAITPVSAAARIAAKGGVA